MPRLSDIEVSQLAAVGFNSYEKGDYDCTIKCLLKVIDNEPKHWRAKLYLGMAYLRAGDKLLGTFQLRFVKVNCPDADMRAEADKAMGTLTQAAAKPTGQGTSGQFDRVSGQPSGEFPRAGQATDKANAGVGPSFGQPVQRTITDKSGWLSASEINSRRKKVEALVQTPKGQRFPLGPTTTIGKNFKNTIRLVEDRTIGEFQAVILFEDSEFWIENSTATNSTRVNGRPVTERTRLRPGDEIRVGQTTFKVE